MMLWRSNLLRRPLFFPIILGIITLFFILLASFTVSSGVVSWPGVTVSLPQMNTVEISDADKVIVTLTAKGEIFYEGKLMTLDSLETALGERRLLDGNIQKNLKLEGRKPTFVLCADRQASLESCASIMDIARNLDMEVMLLADKPAEENIVIRIQEK